MTLSSFSFAYLSLMYVPFEISVAIFCLFYCKLFVFLLLNFENSLYIQDTSPTLDTYFVNIFSQPITYLSIIFHSFLQKADIFLYLSSICHFCSFYEFLCIILDNLCLVQRHRHFLVEVCISC